MPPRKLNAAHAAKVADVLRAPEAVGQAAEGQEDAQQARDHVRVRARAGLRAREGPVVAERAVHRRRVPAQRRERQRRGEGLCAGPAACAAAGAAAVVVVLVRVVAGLDRWWARHGSGGWADERCFARCGGAGARVDAGYACYDVGWWRGDRAAFGWCWRCC